MAKGAPDWWQRTQVDIVWQTKPVVIVETEEACRKRVKNTGIFVPAGSDTTLAQVSVGGCTFGTLVYTTSSLTLNNSKIVIETEVGDLWDMTLGDIVSYYLHQHKGPVQVVALNITSNYYMWYIPLKFRYDSLYRVRYVDDDLDAPIMNCEFWYSEAS